jgi:5-carboxymethyl-2-hydroxymuconic-semialdehyde dehydrogenase
LYVMPAAPIILLQAAITSAGGVVAPEAINHFIGGQYVRSSYLKTFPVADPATGKRYAQVAIGRDADINQAVLAAQAALKEELWAGMAPPERARLLNAIAQAIGSRAGDVAAVEAQGVGLPVTQARELAAQAAEHFRLAADLVTSRYQEDAFVAPGQSGSVVRRPAGVAGVITSWRTPFLAQARAVAPALAAGCGARHRRLAGQQQRFDRDT